MERLIRMSQPGTIERPDLEQVPFDNDQNGYIVTVYNNEVNTYEEVIMILMIATGCAQSEAEIETWEIDHLGKSVVHHGSADVCARVAEIVSKIGIRVEVTQE
jgi:ATP-dependent Clp protease adapter protein ClpS